MNESPTSRKTESMMMRSVGYAVVGILLALPVVPARAQDDGVSAFRFRADRVPIGRVYHYVKTNIDGTKPEQIALYVADTSRIESFKYHPDGDRAGLVIATMDWKIFSASRLESWQVFAGGTKKLFASMDYDSRAREVAVVMGDASKIERVKIPRLPMHVYNFDLSSLNVAFAHLFRPEASFTIGLADPTFTTSPTFAYRGEATVTYTGRSVRNGKACRTYTISGPGLEGRGGTIWVNAAQDHIEDMEIALPDNPEWTSFKLKLVRISTETPVRWQAFQRSSFSKR